MIIGFEVGLLLTAFIFLYQGHIEFPNKRSTQGPTVRLGAVMYGLSLPLMLIYTLVTKPYGDDFLPYFIKIIISTGGLAFCVITFVLAMILMYWASIPDEIAR